MVLPATTVVVDADSVTETTAGCVTFTVATPTFPSTVALTTAEPGATPLAVPDPSMVTADVFDDAHVAVLPVSTVPADVRASKDSACDNPTPIVADEGL